MLTVMTRKLILMVMLRMKRSKFPEIAGLVFVKRTVLWGLMSLIMLMMPLRMYDDLVNCCEVSDLLKHTRSGGVM